MALITRVARLFRADINAVLDRVEEPDILLKQAVRDMEDELGRDAQACKRLAQEQTTLARQQTEFNRQLASIGEELDVCFEAGNEELARSTIRRRLETERSLQLLQNRRQTIDAELDRATQRLDDNRARYESMQQKAALFDDQQLDRDTGHNWPASDIRVRDEDVEIALLKERQRRARP